MKGHVLLVEDSEIIALDTEDMLRSMNFDDVVVARTCEAAFAALRDRRFDCAVLDINLADETSFPVARHLQSIDVPFLFATGYGARLADADLREAVVVSKPYTEQSLGRALGALLAARAGGVTTEAASV
jgi:DNA-binding response OmpR family regulator